MLAKLPREIADEIDYNAFHVGVLGPDPYFFYRFFALPFTFGVDKRGGIMHHHKCNEYLMTLARLCARPVEGGQRETGTLHQRIAFSYFAGALCHYALDSTAHPYINGIAAKRPGMHTAVERKLDRIELKRQGRSLSDIMKLFVPFPEVPEIRAAMKAVYGWDDDHFRDGYRHMRLYLQLVKDEHGILAAVTSAFALVFSPVTRKKADYVRAQSYRNHMGDDLKLEGFDEYERKAVDFAVELITAAEGYRSGTVTDQNLSALIGPRDYSGTPTGTGPDCSK